MNTGNRLATVALGVAGASLVAYVPAEAAYLGNYEGWQTVQYNFAAQPHQSSEAISFDPESAGPAVTVSSVAENRKGKKRPSTVTVVEGQGLGVVSGLGDAWALDTWGKHERLQFSFEENHAARLAKVILAGVDGHEYVVINDVLASTPGKSRIKFKQYRSTEVLEDGGFEFEAAGGDGFYIKKIIFKLLKQDNSSAQYSSTKPYASPGI